MTKWLPLLTEKQFQKCAESYDSYKYMKSFMEGK